MTTIIRDSLQGLERTRENVAFVGLGFSCGLFPI